MAKVLVTGCSGFLAGHLLPRLAAGPGDRVFGLTEVEGFAPPAGVQRVYPVDLCDRRLLPEVIAEVRPQVVYHLAAITNVGFAWKNPLLTYEVNVIGSVALFEALRRFAPGCRVLVMSSAEVYENRGQPLTEASPLHCLNPYALSKMTMEMAAGMYGRVHGLEVIRLRAFNFTGPGQDRKFAASDFAWQIARIERGEQEPLIRIGNLEAVRDFSDVRDIARCLQAVGRGGRNGEVFNLCSGRLYSIRQILDQLLSLSARAIRVEVDADRLRPSDAPLLVGDGGLFQRRFGTGPEIPLERTLADLLQWWRDTLGAAAG